jgi:hypothetical protein
MNNFKETASLNLHRMHIVTDIDPSSICVKQLDTLIQPRVPRNLTGFALNSAPGGPQAK